MSRTVDEKVVSMQFDNRHFESNVQTSMSTLDKLKAKLDFTGASKGLDDVGKAAGNVNMSGLGGAVDTVQAKFSALQVMGVTALANITNSAVNAGKQIVSALTVEPVKQGFSEYELKMDSIKTIMASTGKDVDTVNGYLEELNKYSDQTIYSFSDMTNSIGKFTNAGVELEDAVLAIKGISNEAAVSGANAQEASRAMYNFAQALSSGAVKLIDWKSIENANMATVEFKQQLIDAAVAAGTLTESADGMYTTLKGKTLNATQGFNDTLQDQWMTSEVLINTLKNYADETTEIGKKAFAAAQDVTKLTQVYDILKETAQSGWAKTWELIIGDIEQAKEIFTPLTNFLGGIIDKMSYARNRVLEIGLAFSKPWNAMMDKINGLNKIKKNVGELTKSLEYYQDVVTRVWRGDYNNQGDNPDRRDLLTADGYNKEVVQYLVNKGYLYKLTIEDIEEAYKHFGLTLDENTKKTKDVGTALANLSEEQLTSLGLTEEEIRLYKAVGKEAGRMGISFDKMVERLTKKDGRARLVDGFKNIGNAIAGIGKTISAAFEKIFNPPSLEQLGIRLYFVLEAFENFTKKLRFTEKVTDKNGKEIEQLTETGEKFQRIFKGVFAILDLLVIVIGGPLKIAFEVFKALLGAIDIDILGFVALLSDGIVKVHDWIKGFLNFSWVFEKLQPYLKNAADAIKNFIDNAKPLERISGFFEKLADKFKAWIDSLKDSKNLPEDIAKGIASGFSKAINFVKTKLENFKDLLQNGFDKASESSVGRFAKKLWNGIKLVGAVMRELGKIMLESLNNFLASHGLPQIPTNIISGLVNGIKAGLGRIASVAIDIGKMIINKVKEILEIHSPSAVFFAIGGFLISGLVLGLTNGFPAVKEALQGLGGAILDGVKNIDLGSVFSALSMIMTLFIGKKFTDAIENFSAPFAGIGEVLEAVATTVLGFNKYLKAKSFETITNGIKNLAFAILIIVGALAIITFLDPNKLWNSVAIIGALAGILAVLAIAIGLIGKSSATIGKDGVKINGLKTSLLSIGAAILLVAIAAKLVSTIDPESTKQAFWGMAGIVVAIIGVIAAYGLLIKGKAAQNMDKAGRTLMQFAGAILILAIVAKIMAGMTWEEMGKAGAGIAGLVGVVALLVLITKLAGKHIGKVGATISKIGTAMLLMAIVAKIIVGMSWGEMGKAAVGLLGLVGVITLLIFATKLAGPHVDKLGATILSIAGAMAILTIIAKMIVGMSWGEMGKAAVGLLGLVGVVALLVLVVKMVKQDAPKIAGTLIALSVSIGILALVITLMGFLDIKHILKGILVIGALGVMIAGILLATKSATDCKGNLMAVTAAIAIMALAVAALSFIDPVRLAVATACMGTLMALFALIIKVAGQAKMSMGPLIVMTVAIGVIGGILFLIGQLPYDRAIVAGTALSMVLLSLAASMAIISKAGTLSVKAMVSVALMMGVMVVLALILNKLGTLPVAGCTAASDALCKLLLVMAVSLVLIGKLGTLSVNGLISLAAITAVVAVLAVIIKKLAELPIESTMAVTKSLMTLLLGMVGALGVLTIIGAFAGAAYAGMGALATLIVGLGALMTGIGYLVNEIPKLEEFLDKGIVILEKIGYGLGAFFGGIVSGFSEAIFSTLPALGTCLSMFMINATPFIVGVKMVDASMLEGIGVLTAAIVALTAADLLNGIVSFISGGSNFATLGTELSMFMINATPFIVGAKMLDPTLVESVRTLAEAILLITGANLLDGISKFISGESSMSKFGSELVLLGEGVKGFIASLGPLTDEQVAIAGRAAEIIKTLAKAASDIPNTGGLLGDLIGNNDMGPWAEQLPTMATGIKNFINALNADGALDEGSVSLADTAAKMIETLAAAAKKIPNAGGLLADWIGDNDLSTWAEQLPTVATGIKGFINALTSDGETTFGEEQVNLANKAASVVTTLAKAAKDIPNAGGLLAAWIGDNDLSTWAEELPTLGKGVKGFVDEIGTLDEGSYTSVNTAINAIKAFTGLGGKDVDIGNVSDLGKKLEGFGKKIAAFVTKITGIEADSFKSAISNVNKVIDLVKNTSSIDKESVTAFSDSLNTLGKNGVQKFIDGIDDKKDDAKTKLTELINACVDHIESKDNKSYFKDAAKELIKKFNSGIIDKKKDVKTRIGEMVTEAVDKAKSEDYYDDFKAAGKYLVEGFADGIKANKSLASDAGSALGKAALKAAKEALDENSPSKEMYKVGDFAGIGFVNALYDNVKKAYTAGTEMAGSAKSGLSKAIAKIGEMVNSDMDMQPTIRPVLDLSDIRSGAGAIGSMLGFNSRIGVAANVGAISSSMARGQNGTNSEVVSAINKLRKDVANMPRESYNINGITYDDDSVVTDAIRTIVRAAKIEGRT